MSISCARLSRQHNILIKWVTVVRCPSCNYEDSRVTDSRNVDEAIRRRRQCLSCWFKFTTYERVQHGNLVIIKKDGRREEFNREKIAAGIRKACEKRPLPIGSIEKLVDDIEADLYHLGKAKIPSPMIGEMVMEKLKVLDHIAYIRFASVYRDFADISSLKQEIDSLITTGPSQLPLIPK